MREDRSENITRMALTPGRQEELVKVEHRGDALVRKAEAETRKETRGGA